LLCQTAINVLEDFYNTQGSVECIVEVMTINDLKRSSTNMQWSSVINENILSLSILQLPDIAIQLGAIGMDGLHCEYQTLW
jgi:hypothetical protein